MGEINFSHYWFFVLVFKLVYLSQLGPERATSRQTALFRVRDSKLKMVTSLPLFISLILISFLFGHCIHSNWVLPLLTWPNKRVSGLTWTSKLFPYCKQFEWGVVQSQVRRFCLKFTLAHLNQILYSARYRVGPTVGCHSLRLSVLNRNPTFFFPDLFAFSSK